MLDRKISNKQYGVLSCLDVITQDGEERLCELKTGEKNAHKILCNLVWENIICRWVGTIGSQWIGNM